jgi:hypothetical protein
MRKVTTVKMQLLCLAGVLFLTSALFANENEECHELGVIRPLPFRCYYYSDYADSDVQTSREDDITWPSKYNEDEFYEEFAR